MESRGRRIGGVRDILAALNGIIAISGTPLVTSPKNDGRNFQKGRFGG
jgi:hypothetical protein